MIKLEKNIKINNKKNKIILDRLHDYKSVPQITLTGYRIKW